MWWIVPVLCSAAVGADLFEGKAYYYGDLHSHTGLSGDGVSSDLGEQGGGECGALEDYALLAREAGLDFVALTDHVDRAWAMEEDALAQGLAVLREGQVPGELVTVPGAEVTLSLGDGGDLGHKTLLLFGDDDQLEGLTLDDLRPAGAGAVVESCDAVWSWVAALQRGFGPALLVPHHPAAIRPMGTDWSCHRSAWSPVVEVYSDHGSSMGDGLDFDPPWGGLYELGTVHTALWEHKLRLGFVAGTDRHDTHPGHVCQLDTWVVHAPYGGGLTVAVLDEEQAFDREALHAALVARSTYATSGPMVPVSVTWSSAGAVLGSLGSEVELPLEQPVRADVRVPVGWAAAVRQVVAVTAEAEVVLDPGDTGAWHVELQTAPWVYMRVEVDGEAVYGEDGCEDGGEDATEYLWLSPVWLREGKGDLDADGITWAQGDCHDGDPAVYPGAPEVCDNGADDNCDALVDGLDPGCAVWAGEHAVPQGPADEALTEPERPPSGCTHGSAAGWLVWLVWLPLLALRRRRR